MNQPIFDEQAERALIGSVLIDPNQYRRINITALDFYQIKHQIIWTAIAELSANQEKVDYVTISNHLDKNGKLKDVGGEAYLIKLLTETASSMHGEAYAGIVRDKSRRRSIIQQAGDLATAAYNDPDIETAISKAMANLVRAASPARGAVHIGEFVSEAYDEIIERSKNPNDFYGIKTGMAGFDKITRGLQKQELFLLTGEPGTGKTLLATQLAFGMGKEAAGVIYEMEMSGAQIVRRVLSAMSGVPTDKFRSGRLDGSEFDKMTASVDNMSVRNVYMSDAPNWTTAGIRADLSRLKDLHNVQWFFVDYMALLNDDYGASDNEKYGFISRNLKSICKELNLAGLIIHSMNKGDGDAKKRLRGTYDIAFDADQIAMLTQSGEGNEYRLIWSKIRDGDSSDRMVELVKRPGLPAFADKARP
jgi:replicative DNA helicase